MTNSQPASFDGSKDDAAQRRVIRTLVGAQILSGAGLAAGVSVGALLAQDMFGSEGLAGVPAALFTIGSAGAAVAVGRTSDRHGRRRGLSLGYATGALGAILIVAAASIGSTALLLPSLLIYGAGTATNLQARYAGADLATPEHSARAISTVLVATTIGAVVGPNMISPMGNLAEAVGVPRLAGPFLLAAAAYGLAAVVLQTRLHPDPLLLARERALKSAEAIPVQVTGHDADGAHAPDGAAAHSVGDRPSRESMQRRVLLGGFVMVVAQIVMAAIMTMTPVHMRAHGHGLAASGVVIAAHIAGMYLPSPLTGRLVDRFGASAIAIASGVTLAISGLMAAATPSSSVIGLGAALTVLGLGWNLGLLSGTSIVTDAVPIEVRARTQGSVDLSIAIAGTTGGLGSGVVVASSSYPMLAMVGAVIAIAVLPIVAFTTRSPRNDRVSRAARSSV
ncbi:MAG: MFS transporter [Microthrixaceae bacterium]|nr:MFS transporter [Microthrixaceae bacterium]